MKLSSTFLLAATLSGSIGQASAGNLRANSAAQKRRKAVYKDFNFFECDVVQNMGVAFPGEEDDLAPTLSCETEIDHEFGAVVFNLEGDTEEFFHNLDTSYGDVRIRVPVDIVGEHDVINFDEVTSKQIAITYTGNERRNLATSDSTGTKHVLVIRVSNDINKDSNPSSKVAQSAAQLSDDIFGSNSNLKTIYEKCSDGKLRINPATGPGINNGVLSLEAPGNICSMSYNDVSSWAFQQYEVDRLFASGSTAKVSHKIFVMPNNPCVDFNGAAAWGQVNRSISWYQSRSVSFPAVHVHEFGHNLGMKHSGAPDDQGVYRAYADGNGYMGNRAIWDPEGSDMCFNAAKMWYFEWWSSYQRTVEPAQTAQSAQILKLIPLYDLERGNYVQGSNMILKVSSNGSNLYINFNVAKGLNAGVRADPNKVVITEQNGKTVVSTWKASLASQDIYRQENWAGTGKALIVEVLNANIGNGENTSIAEVKIYLDSGPAVDVPSTCTDTVPSGESKWHDSDGQDYDCDWYALSTNCAQHGDQFLKFGLTANQACCACKSNTCTDMVPSGQEKWFDADGPDYNCAWYATNNNCALYGGKYANFGATANQACCACQ